MVYVPDNEASVTTTCADEIAKSSAAAAGEWMIHSSAQTDLSNTAASYSGGGSDATAL